MTAAGAVTRVDFPYGKHTDKNRGGAYKEWMAQFTPELIEKVSRIVSLGRVAASSRRDRHQQSQEVQQFMREERERRIVVRGHTGPGVSDELAIIDARLEGLELRKRALLEVPQPQYEQESAAIRVAESVLKEIKIRFGGGANCEQLFAAMGWE